MSKIIPSDDALDYWRLCDRISVVQAALLIVGKNPAGLHRSMLSIQPTGDRPAMMP
jgi:hypothetical protein